MSGGTLKSGACDGLGSAVGSYTRRWMARERPGRNELPDHRAVESTMTASEFTPAEGTSVSDEQLSDRLAEIHAREVGEAMDLLRKSAESGVGLEGVAVRVKEARARLEYFEREIEKARDGGEPHE